MQKQYLPRLISVLFFTSLSVFIQLQIQAQTVQITANPNQSQNIVLGPNNYHVSENIYTDAEVGISNFTSAATAINHIDFNVQTIGANTTVNNYNIYLRDLAPDTTTFTSTTDTYYPALYTLVFSGTFTPSVTGWTGVDFTTSFIRTSGKNLELLIERLDNLPHAGFFFRSALGNTTSSTITTSRRVNPNILPVPGATLLSTISANRPQVQLRHINANDAAVSQIYTLGKLPIPFAAPHIISAIITNNGSQALTNLAVTLNISGANTFNDVQTITSLARGAQTTVFFNAFSPASAGNNIVTVSIPPDDFSNDNSVSIPQVVSNNAYSYAYGNISSGSLGITPGPFNLPKTGDIVAKFISSSPTSVNQVGVTFAAGGIPFKIGIWDKSGNGVPGNLLWQSDSLITTQGVFTLPVSPPISITDTFYVGVRQITTTSVQFAYQTETPVRANTFFYDTLSKATWIDFASLNGGPFRFMIEPRLTVANDVGVSTLNNPIAASTVDNCGLVPKATISNFGSNNQVSPFDVTYIIKQSGAVVYNDTKPVSLLSGESKELSFASFTGSVTGTDSSICFTSLATDNARNNDTLVNSFSTNNYSYGGGAMANGGYEFANSTSCAAPAVIKPTYNWLTQTTNEINWGANGDDSVLATPISLPFVFRYFGVDYSQCWICSNGWISFADPAAITAAVQKTPVTIPTAGGINNYIAAMLADLDITTGTYPDAHTYYDGDATQFVITFLHAHLKGSPDFISFQIILKADGNIYIQYNDAETTSPVPSAVTNKCSIGIENATGTEGIQYRLNGNFGSMFGSPLVVRFRPPFSVPVILLGFSAQRNNRINKITWSTSQEINLRQFVIERSNDGSRFVPIGQVAAAGNSNNTRAYLFTDNAPVKGINYYRLKMVDADNISRYSLVRNIRNEGIADVAVYPNPVTDLLTISITADNQGTANITITDNSGRLVYSKTSAIIGGGNTISINTTHLSHGTYIAKIQLSGDVILKKLTKL